MHYASPGIDLATKMELKMLQINCRRCERVMDEVVQIMREKGCQIALLQEPYVGGDMPGDMRFFVNRTETAAILVDDADIQCIVYPGIEDCGVYLRLEGVFGVVFAVSLYCRPRENIEGYLRLLDGVLLSSSSQPLIICMDANAASPLWFSKISAQARRYESFSRGQLLAEWLSTSDVHVLNEPSELYSFESPNGVSDIDVTLACRRMLAKFETCWTIWDGCVSGDHNPIMITLGAKQHSEVVETGGHRRWCTKRYVWQFYEQLMREEAETACPIDDFKEISLKQQLSKMQQIVSSVNDRVLGRYVVPAGKRTPWWSRELAAKKMSIVRLRRRFRRARRRDDVSIGQLKVELQVVLAEYKGMIRVAKEDQWNAFVSDNRDDPWGRVYRECRRRTKAADIECIQVGEEIIDTWYNCTKALLANFFPVPNMRMLNHGPDPLPEELQSAELSTCINLARSSGSPGMDGITGRMVKAMWKAIPDHVLTLMASCLRLGYFPEEWKAARVVVLLKSPDKVRSNPGSYRGICLLSVLGKILERVMVRRLLDSIDGRFSSWQFGFQAERCIEDAWMHIKQCVSTSTNKYVLGVFVDFKGAFDNLEWSAIIQRLQDIGCKEMALWRNYFSGRKARATSSAGVVEVVVRRGCPQGSVVGPYVWNLMMDVLLQELGLHCKFSAYADDLLLLVEGQSRAELERRGTALMQIVAEWSRKVGVQVSLDKTVMMLLRGRLSLTRPPNVRCADKGLKYVQQVKYLGLTVGERLNFLPHLKVVRSKMMTAVESMKRILRVKHGLSRRAVRIIHKGVFKQCGLFGAAVWSDIVKTVHGRRSLLSCQRIPLLACLAVCRTVSTDALQVLAGDMPWDLEARRVTIAYKVKTGLALDADERIAESETSWLRRKAAIEEHLMDEWQSRWDESVNGRITYGFIPDVRFISGVPEVSFTMRTCFLLTGHGSLSGFLVGRNLMEDSSCVCGEQVETAMHMLCTCPLYEDIRNLDALQITLHGNNHDVRHCLSTQESRNSLEVFAQEAFTRRYQLTHW